MSLNLLNCSILFSFFKLVFISSRAASLLADHKHKSPSSYAEHLPAVWVLALSLIRCGALPGDEIRTEVGTSHYPKSSTYSAVSTLYDEQDATSHSDRTKLSQRTTGHRINAGLRPQRSSLRDDTSTKAGNPHYPAGGELQ